MKLYSKLKLWPNEISFSKLPSDKKSLKEHHVAEPLNLMMSRIKLWISSMNQAAESKKLIKTVYCNSREI